MTIQEKAVKYLEKQSLTEAARENIRFQIVGMTGAAIPKRLSDERLVRWLIGLQLEMGGRRI